MHQGHWARRKIQQWNHGRTIWPRRQNPSPCSDLATEPQRGRSCTTSSVICFQSFIRRGRTEEGRGEQWRQMPKSCHHAAYLQIRKESCNRSGEGRKGQMWGKGSFFKAVINKIPKQELKIGDRQQGVSNLEWGQRCQVSAHLRRPGTSAREPQSMTWAHEDACVDALAGQRPRLSWICPGWVWEGLRDFAGQWDGTYWPLSASSSRPN